MSHRKKYQTQWAAQFYAAAELTRRGYLVSLTFGNAPAVDLFVESPNGQIFTVDVKGQSTRNFWLIQRRGHSPNHFFILVFLPKNLEQAEYFILSSVELMKRRAEYEVQSKKRGKYRDDMGGINFKTAYDYKDEWGSLPQ